jgi:hypothetical protein
VLPFTCEARRDAGDVGELALHALLDAPAPHAANSRVIAQDEDDQATVATAQVLNVLFRLVIVVDGYAP